MHLLQLMTSWAVVCDVWYLEPQNIRPGESPIEFAERLKTFFSGLVINNTMLPPARLVWSCLSHSFESFYAGSEI